MVPVDFGSKAREEEYPSSAEVWEQDLDRLQNSNPVIRTRIACKQAGIAALPAQAPAGEGVWAELNKRVRVGAATVARCWPGAVLALVAIAFSSLAHLMHRLVTLSAAQWARVQQRGEGGV